MLATPKLSDGESNRKEWSAHEGIAEKFGTDQLKNDNIQWLESDDDTNCQILDFDFSDEDNDALVVHMGE